MKKLVILSLLACMFLCGCDSDRDDVHAHRAALEQQYEQGYEDGYRDAYMELTGSPP